MTNTQSELGGVDRVPDRRLGEQGQHITPNSEVTLIQCTNSKRDHRCIAHDLYDESAYFRKMRSWAKSRDSPWFILSAKHGLLAPDAEIEPYNKRGLSELKSDGIAHVLAGKGVETVHVCAGREYLDHLTPALEAEGIDVVDEFAGLRIGKRMSKLDELVDA